MAASRKERVRIGFWSPEVEVDDLAEDADFETRGWGQCEARMDEEAGNRSKVRALATGIYRIWIGERPGPLAASLAYYGLFSMVPVTYVAVVISGIFVDTSDLIIQIEDQLEELLGPQAVEQLVSAVDALADRTVQGSALASAISFIVLLFTASLIFFQFQYVLNNVWKAPPPSRDETRNYIRNRLLAFVMVLSVGLILVLATFANIIISLVSRLVGLEGSLLLVNYLVYGTLLSLALALIYKVLPNVAVAWRDVLVGSIVTAILMIVALQIFGFMLSTNRFETALQAAGSIALFLISFYFFGTIFIFGAVFIRVYASVFGSRAKLSELTGTTAENEVD
jgi:membrane protein